MPTPKNLDTFLQAYREVAERVRHIEIEATIARITIEDITTRLRMELNPLKPQRRGKRPRK